MPVGVPELDRRILRSTDPQIHSPTMPGRNNTQTMICSTMNPPHHIAKITMA